MSRGKEAFAATNRRLHEADTRIAELERELAETKAAARRREVDLKEQLIRQGSEVRERTAEAVQELMGRRIEDISQGVSSAVWQAQRVAMTEHLTWLFFKGYMKWDRMAGDREVLKFLATHGDLSAWFRLTDQYGHFANHGTRRANAKLNPTLQMLAVIQDILKQDGDRPVRESREALDAVVDVARDAFVNVELSEVLTDSGWEQREPSADEVAMHQKIMDALPEFEAVHDRIAQADQGKGRKISNATRTKLVRG